MKTLFSSDEDAVFYRWRRCFLAMKTLFSIDEDAVFYRWRRCFLAMKTLFSIDEDAVFYQWRCCFLSMKTLFSIDEDAVFYRSVWLTVEVREEESGFFPPFFFGLRMSGPRLMRTTWMSEAWTHGRFLPVSKETIKTLFLFTDNPSPSECGESLPLSLLSVSNARFSIGDVSGNHNMTFGRAQLRSSRCFLLSRRVRLSEYFRVLNLVEENVALKANQGCFLNTCFGNDVDIFFNWLTEDVTSHKSVKIKSDCHTRPTNHTSYGDVPFTANNQKFTFYTD